MTDAEQQDLLNCWERIGIYPRLFLRAASRLTGDARAACIELARVAVVHGVTPRVVEPPAFDDELTDLIRHLGRRR